MSENPTTADPNRRLAYSAEEAFRQIGLGRTKGFEEIRNGRLRALKAGSRTIITHEACCEYLASLPAVEPA